MKYATYVCIKNGLIECRFPYNPKLIAAVKAVVPYEHRRPPEFGFRKATASWVFPEDYLPDIESLAKSILYDLPYFEVDELPPFKGLDIEAAV